MDLPIVNDVETHVVICRKSSSSCSSWTSDDIDSVSDIFIDKCRLNCFERFCYKRIKTGTGTLAAARHDSAASFRQSVLLVLKIIIFNAVSENGNFMTAITSVVSLLISRTDRRVSGWLSWLWTSSWTDTTSSLVLSVRLSRCFSSSPLSRGTDFPCVTTQARQGSGFVRRLSHEFPCLIIAFLLLQCFNENFVFSQKTIIFIYDDVMT